MRLEISPKQAAVAPAALRLYADLLASRRYTFTPGEVGLTPGTIRRYGRLLEEAEICSIRADYGQGTYSLKWESQDPAEVFETRWRLREESVDYPFTRQHYDAIRTTSPEMTDDHFARLLWAKLLEAVATGVDRRYLMSWLRKGLDLLSRDYPSDNSRHSEHPKGIDPWLKQRIRREMRAS